MPAAADTTPVANGPSPHQKTMGKAYGSATVLRSGADIIDIRRATVEFNLKADILTLFRPKEGPRHLPTMLLYDEKGLQLFEDITYLDEYYLTNDEIAILESHAVEIAQKIHSGSMIIELGSGNLRKVKLLLQAINSAGKSVDYYALDLDKKELERTLGQLPVYENVRCHGLHGTFDDGREWLKTPANASRRKCILFMGSSIGNFSRNDAPGFLREFADVLHGDDAMLIGLDACNDPARVYHAYNDKEGITHRFLLNGLVHANSLLGEEAFKLDDWKVIGEYVYDVEGGRHQAFYAPRRDTVVLGELVPSHERIQVEMSLKYSQQEAEKLWNSAGMIEVAQWRKADEYGLHLIAKSTMGFSRSSSAYAAEVLPTLEDWKALWQVWDMVTRKMLPEEELLDKPIKLRNACIFYLGHIPTFLDIQLTKTTKMRPTDPASYYQIFERGVDPDVDNPELCHAHSEIPDEWPPLDEILAYQERVRARLTWLYKSPGGVQSMPRDVARAIWVGFEHELMHIETLLYMMLQSDKTLPPTGTPAPNFEKMAAKAKAEKVPNQWFDVPAQEITIGINDPDEGTDPSLDFGWDNEKPVRKTAVHAFQAKGRPITNEEYAQYMVNNHITKIPASWAETPAAVQNGVTTNGTNGHQSNGYTNGDSNGHSNGHTNGETNGLTNGHAADHSDTNGAGQSPVPSSFYEGKSVRTVYGLVPLHLALDWPIFASYDELLGCAAWMGGRIPTFEEARSIYSYVDGQKREASLRLGRTVPAVNAQLTNNGVEETPPARGTSPAVGEQQEDNNKSSLFIDLDGANVGFSNWHPVAVTANGNRLAGQGEMGGVWEWTSTVLAPWDGFKPMAMYPGYTADFFDEKHNIVLGGSWATHPRIAGRKSFVNWYQRNYLYPWTGARLVRDLQ